MTLIEDHATEDHDCPKCGRATGYRCVKLDGPQAGAELAHPHHERRELARIAGNWRAGMPARGARKRDLP